jgi:hypothetical protein
MSDQDADIAERIAALDASLDFLEAAVREPSAASDERPLFLASVGWRTGSTLIQRILMTDPTMLVWGEPLGHLAMVSRMMRPLHGFTSTWPPSGHWLSHLVEPDLTRDWVANMTPDAGHLKAACRAFLDRWLATPAYERGFRRWGMKEVRWGAEEVIFLRWLYPNSRFLLSVRHPVSVYRSLKRAGFLPGKVGLVFEWPDDWVADLETFAHLWNRLALEWTAVARRLGVVRVRYEDLVGGLTDLAALGRDLELVLNPEPALAVRAGEGFIDAEVTREDRDRINAITLAGREAFLYAE